MGTGGERAFFSTFKMQAPSCGDGSAEHRVSPTNVAGGGLWAATRQSQHRPVLYFYLSN
ncbi:MAG: hypothetical protein ACK55Z_29040 [bacterium]